eukprot:1156526-Pelagomonas_calceolata.AAC.10
MRSEVGIFDAHLTFKSINSFAEPEVSKLKSHATEAPTLEVPARCTSKTNCRKGSTAITNAALFRFSPIKTAKCLATRTDQLASLALLPSPWLVQSQGTFGKILARQGTYP